MADLRRSLEKQMIISRVQGQEVMQKVGITEEEALAYHAAHRNEFTKPASVTLREIQLNVPSSAEGRQRRRRPGHPRAARGDSRARQGRRGVREDRRRSCRMRRPRANGGLIGPLTMTELAPALQKLLSGMKPGDISEPLRTPKGYQLLKLETHDAGRGAAARAGARSDRREAVRGQARRRAAEVPGEDAQGSHHRVEERRAPEGLRGGPRGRRRRDDRAAAGSAASPRPADRRRASVDERRRPSAAAPAQAPERRHGGLRSGRGAATSARCSISSPSAASRRSCRPRRAGAAGRIARRRSTGRSSPATASRASRRRAACRS